MKKMTFGNIKSMIESNLLESYKNENDFRKSLREFKQNVLSNKSLSKAYSIYDQLSTPQGLTEEDAKDFLQEGINVLQKILPSIKLPKSLKEENKNNYSDIDTLVYFNKINLSERLQSKKNILSILTTKKGSLKESINIPIKTMVSIANQTLKTYLENLDENSKKEFFQLISEDTKILETKFEDLKEKTLSKLILVLEKEEEVDLKNKISETIEKVKSEKFDQINFLKLKELESSI